MQGSSLSVDDGGDLVVNAVQYHSQTVFVMSHCLEASMYCVLWYDIPTVVYDIRVKPIGSNLD